MQKNKASLAKMYMLAFSLLQLAPDESEAAHEENELVEELANLLEVLPDDCLLQ